MINIDALNDDEKLAALESIHKSIAESKEIQKKKITTNVEMILKALKKIEGDLKQRYDETGNLIANLKNGTDGRDGKEGRDGKDGRAGKDGAMGPRGYDGLPGRNGLDGEDGVSITDAHIDFDGSLIISLSTGRVINVGEVVTADIAERIKVITNGGGTSQYVLDTLASLQSQISSITSGLEYQGTWNASTNVPTLASSVGTAGYYYIVATAGSTNLNGITDWQVGDWAVFNGTVWQKIDQTNLVTSVAGRTGAIVLTTADIGGLGTIATQASSNVSITGGSITGITDLAIADGGTGQSTAAAAITALTGTQTSGYYLRSNGTNSVLAAIVAADVPTLNQNTTGSAGSLSNTLPVSQGGTNLTSLTNKGVLYASSTSQVATGTALQFDGTNLGVGTTQSTWGATFKAIEIGEQGSIAYESNGSTKKTYLSTNAYNATAIGARPYYKVNGLASEYTQNVGEHAWYTAPTGIAGSSTTITSGQIYTNLTAGNQPDFGAVNGLVGTIWTATSSGTLTSGTVVQNISFIESMRIDASSNVGIGISNPGSRLDVKGTLRLSGSTSGYVGLAPAAAAGSTTYTLPSADGTSGQSLTTNGSGTLSWASGSSATVTSVAASGGTTGLTFSGSPITTSGTLTLSGTLAIANGGTGQTTANAAFNAFAPSQTGNSGKYLTTDGTDTSWATNPLGTVTSVAASVPTFLSVTGSPITTSGTLAISLSGTALPTTSGGTGLTSFTSGGVVYASSTSALATGSALSFNGTQLGVGTSSYATGASLTLDKSGSNLLHMQVGGTSELYFYTDAALTSIASPTNPLLFEVGGSEQMRLTTTGLGIGTSSPAGKLDVQNNQNATSEFYFRNTDTTNTSSRASLNVIAGAQSFSILGINADNVYLQRASGGLYFQLAGSTQALIDSSGNLGLGVTPSAWDAAVYKALQISTNSSIASFTNGETRYSSNCFYNTSTWKYITSSQLASAYTQGAGAHTWFTAPSGTAGNAITFTQAMTLDASGNLLVGTTSAYASGATPHLFVSANTSGSYVGVFKNANATPGCLILDLSADPNNTSDTYIATGQNRFKVLSNGNVQNTNNSYGAISDVKLKENIVDASPKLVDLMQVKVRNYNLIGETTKQIGVVAQELETVFPAMVDESLDRDAEGNDLGTTTKSVKYSVFVPMLIKAMQEQQAIIESLKARLDAANL